MALDPAVELARRRAAESGGGDMDGPSAKRWGSTRGAGDFSGDGNISQIAFPRGARASKDTDFAGLPYDGGYSTSHTSPYDGPSTPHTARKRVEELSAEERDAELRDMYERGEDTTQVRRDIQVEFDKHELDKRKRFTNLAYSAAKWFIIILGITFLIGFAAFVYVNVMNGSFSDASIFTAILGTFAEIFKTIFGNTPSF